MEEVEHVSFFLKIVRKTSLFNSKAKLEKSRSLCTTNTYLNKLSVMGGQMVKANLRHHTKNQIRSKMRITREITKTYTRKEHTYKLTIKFACIESAANERLNYIYNISYLF